VVPVTGEVIDESTRWRMLLDALSIHKRLSERSEMVSPGAARHRGGRFTEDRGRRPGEDCTIDQVDGLVTDDVADPDQVRRLRDAGVDVTLV